MKNGIGLFLLLLSTELFAGSSGILMLRARVPASYDVKLEKQGDRVVPVVHSNRARIVPKVSMVRKNNLRLVSVVHP